MRVPSLFLYAFWFLCFSLKSAVTSHSLLPFSYNCSLRHSKELAVQSSSVWNGGAFEPWIEHFSPQQQEAWVCPWLGSSAVELLWDHRCTPPGDHQHLPGHQPCHPHCSPKQQSLQCSCSAPSKFCSDVFTLICSMVSVKYIYILNDEIDLQIKLFVKLMEDKKTNWFSPHPVKTNEMSWATTSLNHAPCSLRHSLCLYNWHSIFRVFDWPLLCITFRYYCFAWFLYMFLSIFSVLHPTQIQDPSSLLLTSLCTCTHSCRPSVRPVPLSTCVSPLWASLVRL